MRAQARPPRPLWPWIAGGILVLALVVTAVAVLAPHDDSTEPSAIATTSTSTPSPDVVDPTGCIAGAGVDAAMVLAAQDAAPQTQEGAVEFAAALMRWMHRYPNAAREDAAQLDAAVLASSSAYSLAAAVADDPNTSAGLVPDGTPFQTTTRLGEWYVESYAGDTATVSISLGLVIEGELHPQFRLAKTFALVWENGHWTFDAASLPRTTEELAAIGETFTEGC